MPPTPKDLGPLLASYGAQIRALLDEGAKDTAIAGALGGNLSRHMVRRLIKAIQADGDLDPDDGKDWQVQELGDDAKVWSRKGAAIHTVDELLEAADIDLDQWLPYGGQVGTWEAFAKVKRPKEQGGEVVVKETMHKVSVRLERRFDVGLQPPEPIRKFSAPLPPDPGEEQTVVYVGDSQCGFKWSEHKDYLDPMHDRGVLDAAVQYVAQVQPSIVVFMGDMLDLAALSTKFPRPVALRGCDKPALWEWHWWMAQFRQAAPGARLIWLEGNHELRYQKYLTEKASDIRGLLYRVGEDTPSNPLAWLTRCEDLGVEYVGPYGEVTYLDGPIKLTHSETARAKPGQTVGSMIEKSHSSFVIGHVHRGEVVHRRVMDPGKGERTIFGMCPGATCRIEPGIVPAAKRYVDWQQGIGVSRYYPEVGAVTADFLRYEGGLLLADRGPIQGRDRAEEIASFTGYPQIVGMK